MKLELTEVNLYQCIILEVPDVLQIHFRRNSHSGTADPVRVPWALPPRSLHRPGHGPQCSFCSVYQEKNAHGFQK